MRGQQRIVHLHRSHQHLVIARQTALWHELISRDQARIVHIRGRVDDLMRMVMVMVEIIVMVMRMLVDGMVMARGI